MKVFVATYEHRHGMDISVYATRELAEIARQNVARDYWWELFAEESDEPFDEADPGGSADLYFERMSARGDEWFNIEECEVEDDEHEAHRMLTLSTAHLKTSTISNPHMKTDDVPIAFAKDLHGWFMPVLDPYPDGIPNTCPSDLLVILDYARKRGFTWLMFDSDGPLIDGLANWGAKV